MSNLCAVQPHTTICLGTFFIPWTTGKYEYILTVGDADKELFEQELDTAKDGSKAKVQGRKRNIIRGLWVGRFTFRGTIDVLPIDLAAVSQTEEEYRRKNAKDTNEELERVWPSYLGHKAILR